MRPTGPLKLHFCLALPSFAKAFLQGQAQTKVKPFRFKMPEVLNKTPLNIMNNKETKGVPFRYNLKE